MKYLSHSRSKAKRALKPIAETTGDRNSYGFREGRSCADAIGQAFCALAKSYAPVWVLEGDIKSCFDRISHKWLLANIPMDARILRQWLAAGYLEKGRLFPTREGTPQGGIVSPVLANLTLDGMEKAIRSRIRIRRDQVNFIRYADDVAVTGDSKEILEQKVKPAVVEFLDKRALALSEEKTVITHITQGFNFLGQNVRKYGQKLLIKPSRQSVRSVLEKARDHIKKGHGKKAEVLVRKLNPLLRGWANYHRHVVSKRRFASIDYHLHGLLRRWARREHPNKSAGWIRQRYFSADAKGAFSIRTQDRKGQAQVLKVYRLAETIIERHIKVRGAANPYDPADTEYFENRRCFAGRTYPLGNPGPSRPGRQLFPTADRPLEQAIRCVANSAHPVDGSVDRVATGAHSGQRARRERCHHRPRRLSGGQPDLSSERAARFGGARLGAVDYRPSVGGFQLQLLELAY